MNRIGILGGTFNPIHIGHLAIAQTVLEKLKLDCVLFIPSNLPPHKASTDVISATKRLAMVRLAIRHYQKFKVSNFEVSRPGKSYSIDTVRHLSKHFTNKTKFFFIIGQDSLPTLHSWKEIDNLRKLVTFVVVNREGIKVKKGKMRVQSLTMPGLDVSSSFIRERILKKQTVRYLLPEAVEMYIQKHKLYS
jgi:nicotinate-nucleotide adenylyltransferase